MTIASYTRVRRYGQFQAANPNTVFNGADFDGDYDAIKVVCDAVVAAIAQVRRDDGALANGCVTTDSISASLAVLLGGWNPRGAWVTATVYAPKDFVTNAGNNYVCNTPNTSGTFATDLAAGKWSVVASIGVTGAAGPIGYLATIPLSFVMPAIGSDVAVVPSSVALLYANQTLSVEGAGLMTVDTIVGSTVNLKNPGAVGNTVAGATIAASAILTPAGSTGLTGGPGTAGAAGTNWTAGETYTTPAITAGTLTLDLSTGTVFKVTMNGALTTLAITNAPASKAFGFLLETIGNGTAQTQTGFSILKAAGGATFPTVTSTTGKKDVYACWTDDGGVTFYYAVVGQAF